SMMPLFQTQASGLPAMAQRKIGFCSVAASRCASRSDSFHGMVRQTSSFGGRTSLCSLLNSSSVRLPTAGSLAFSVRFAVSKPITANVSNTAGKTFCPGINMAADAPFVMVHPLDVGGQREPWVEPGLAGGRPDREADLSQMNAPWVLLCDSSGGWDPPEGTVATIFSPQMPPAPIPSPPQPSAPDPSP